MGKAEDGTKTKHILKYGLVLILPTAFLLVYGFAAGGEPPEWLLGATFCLGFLVLAFLERKHLNDGISEKIFKTLLVAIVAVGIGFMTYHCVNRLGKTPASAYDATVTEVLVNRGKVTVYFMDPYGTEKTTDYFEWNNFKVFPDEANEIQAGDTIHITEYSALFGVNYCGILTKAEP